MHTTEQHPQASPDSHQGTPREDASEGSRPSKTAAHGQDFMRSPGLPDRGELLAHAEYTTNPGGPTQRAPQRQADWEGYYVFATSKYRRQRATNTATAYVSFCHLNPSMDCVADVNRAENCSRMGASAVHSNMT
jgi:hypothetical protein